jgi:excisionase family DNA binding protein
MSHASRRFLLIEEVAEIARCCESTVRHWLATGRLRSIRPGRRRLIASTELERFLAADRAPGLERTPPPTGTKREVGTANRGSTRVGHD